MKKVAKKIVSGIFDGIILLALIVPVLLVLAAYYIHQLYKWSKGEEEYYSNDI